MSLEGKNAVVTGGARGIGRAIATVLAARGAAVAVWDLNAEGAEQTVDMIRQAGGKAIAVAGDAANADAIAASAARTREKLGAITILVNNAGISSYVPFTSLSEEVWDRIIGVNLKGPFLVTKEFVPGMLEAGWGRIVNIGFTKALAIEFADKGITVNHVPPGFVDTPLVREGPINVEAVAQQMPMKRAGQPNDIAHAVAYLVSEEAGYVTGQTLSVNGGRYLF